MKKIINFILDFYTQAGFFLGVVFSLSLLYIITPSINKPIIEEKIIHDTIVVYKLKATYYNPVKKQCWGNPLITADGTKLNKETKSAAISRDLRSSLPYGSKIKLIYPKHLSGIYTVNDCMNKRFKNHVDLFVWKGKINIDTIKFIKV